MQPSFDEEEVKIIFRSRINPLQKVKERWRNQTLNDGRGFALLLHKGPFDPVDLINLTGTTYVQVSDRCTKAFTYFSFSIENVIILHLQ